MHPSQTHSWKQVSPLHLLPPPPCRNSEESDPAPSWLPKLNSLKWYFCAIPLRCYARVRATMMSRNKKECENNLFPLLFGGFSVRTVINNVLGVAFFFFFWTLSVCVKGTFARVMWQRGWMCAEQMGCHLHSTCAAASWTDVTPSQRLYYK